VHQTWGLSQSNRGINCFWVWIRENYFDFDS
jgi:hypothetical protein